MAENFPIGFWNYPHTSVTPLSEVARWKECGMTWVQTPFFNYKEDKKEDMLAFLDEIDKAGMVAFVSVTDLEYRYFVGDTERFDGVLARVLGDFGKHPAVRGFYLGDEPASEEQCAAAVVCVQKMKAAAPDLIPFLNLLPYWPGIEQEAFGGVEFEAWLDRYIKASGSPMISYDCYFQLDAAKDGIDKYYASLLRFTEAAKRNHVKLWNTLLSCGHFRYRVPTEDDLRWQLNTSVACGCDGIWWFLYYGADLHCNYRMAPVDEFGEETETYTRLRRVQKIFHQKHGGVLAPLHFDRAWHVFHAYGGYEMYKQYEIPHVKQLVSDHELPAVPSRFMSDGGKEYIVVVNNSQTESGIFRLVLDRGLKKMERYWGKEQPLDVVADHYDLFYEEREDKIRVGMWLAPGQMEIFSLTY